jgi:hypothetical protein
LPFEEWFPNAYIKRYDVARFEGGGLVIDNTSSGISSPITLASTITLANHCSSVIFFAMVSR